MITALSWIPRGAARRHPVRFELSREEVERVQTLAKEEEELEQEQLGDISDAGESDDAEEEGADVDTSDLPAELKMDEYDDEDEANGLLVNEDEDEEEDGMIMDNNLLMEENEDDEDQEDDEIKDDDLLLALALTEDEYSRLEIQVLSAEGSLYTHHDILLPDFPLCLAWMDCPPFVAADGQQNAMGNFMAVGTFSPAIEIWNLDVMDVIEPAAALGGTKGKPKKNKSKETFLPGSHEDAVLSLSWNSVFRQALASGSADKTVKVWDVTSQTCSHTFKHHTDKVQSVNWHPKEAWLLASGAFDKTVQLIDCRTGAASKVCEVDGETECLAWDPFNSYHLYASLETGDVVCMDIRNCVSGKTAKNMQQNIITAFRAHGKAASSLQFSSKVDGLLATASVDKTVKVWDTKSFAHAGSEGPQCVAYKTMNVGKLLTMRFSPDDPYLLATAGDKGMVAIWESDESEHIRNHFESRSLSDAAGESGEIVGIQAAPTVVTEAELEDELMNNDGVAGAGPSKAHRKPKSKKNKH